MNRSTVVDLHFGMQINPIPFLTESCNVVPVWCYVSSIQPYSVLFRVSNTCS